MRVKVLELCSLVMSNVLRTVSIVKMLCDSAKFFRSCVTNVPGLV
jgi:hypothetical protein